MLVPRLCFPLKSIHYWFTSCHRACFDVNFQNEKIQVCGPQPTLIQQEPGTKIGGGPSGRSQRYDPYNFEWRISARGNQLRSTDTETRGQSCHPTATRSSGDPGRAMQVARPEGTRAVRKIAITLTTFCRFIFGHEWLNQQSDNVVASIAKYR